LVHKETGVKATTDGGWSKHDLGFCPDVFELKLEFGELLYVDLDLLKEEWNGTVYTVKISELELTHRETGEVCFCDTIYCEAGKHYSWYQFESVGGTVKIPFTELGTLKCKWKKNSFDSVWVYRISL